MDDDDRRRSQYGPPYPPLGPSRPPHGQALGPPTTDRFSQPSTPVRSDPTRHSMSRSYLPSYPGYGYQDPSYPSSSLQHGSSPLQGVEMQYSPAYVQDMSRQQAAVQSQQSQQYVQYGPGPILPSVQQQRMYEAIPQYQQRQSAAIEVMSSQMGAMPQYLPTSSSQFGPSRPEQQTYPSAVQSGTLLSQYSSQPVEYDMIEQSSIPQPAQASAAEQEALEEGFREYKQQLQATFEDIVAGRVVEAADKVLVLSRWLTNSVLPLGLHHDDETRYAERLQLWQQFNLCWEALGQRQKSITEEALRSGRQPPDILTAEKMQAMVDELLSLCDQLEQYGLVDYEIGVAEEQITHIFAVCLELVKRDDTRGSSQMTAQPRS